MMKNAIGKVTSFAVSFFLFLTCASNNAPRGGELAPSDPRATVGVTSTNMCVPAGLFFLVRKGQQRAAVRFTEVHRLKEEGTGYATYESYEQSDDRGMFIGSAKRTGAVSVLGWGGFHPFSYQKGQAELNAGPVTLDYNFPSCISFTPHGRSPGDYGIEMAPTRWTDIQEVNASAPTLRWFGYDAGGERHLELQREGL